MKRIINYIEQITIKIRILVLYRFRILQNQPPETRIYLRKNRFKTSIELSIHLIYEDRIFSHRKSKHMKRTCFIHNDKFINKSLHLLTQRFIMIEMRGIHNLCNVKTHPSLIYRNRKMSVL